MKWRSSQFAPNTIDEILADLANYGLEPSIDIRSVTPSTPIALKFIDEKAELEFPEDQVVEGDEADQSKVLTSVQRLLVGSLPSALGGVVSVTPQGSIEQAITKMVLSDFSQLAVMATERSRPKAVSWRSIARARNVDPSCSLQAALFEPQVFRYDDDLIAVLPVLDEDEFFLVRGPTNEIAGIVTASDVVRAYRGLASPFLLIGEIDQTLRRIVEVTYDSVTIIEACDPDGSRGINAASEMSIGDYLRILQSDSRWAALDWRLDRALFCARLDEVRQLRNQVMHFTGDSLSESSITMLRNFLSLLREYSVE